MRPACIRQVCRGEGVVERMVMQPHIILQYASQGQDAPLSIRTAGLAKADKKRTTYLLFGMNQLTTSLCGVIFVFLHIFICGLEQWSARHFDLVKAGSSILPPATTKTVKQLIYEDSNIVNQAEMVR